VLRPDGLIGRDRERDVAAIFVAASASGPAVLLIDGEAGIGKTTLFRYTVDLARLGGSTVLECSPTQAESAMSYVGLTDMLRNLPGSAFDALPAPQRHSLEVATLRTAPSEVPLDERAVGTGLATLVGHLAESTAVILAVDDLQWLDRSSADVLTFAARRLTSAPVGIVTCERTGESIHNLVDAVHAPLWRESISLTGLGAAVLFHVVRDQLGITLARPALVRVAETSGGNPFAALALSRAVGRGADPPGGVRISDLVHGLNADRMNELTEPAREALLAAASSPRALVPMFAALGLAEALDEVESNGMVHVVAGRVVFTHPLLAAAVSQMASSSQQRAMHARLAAVADDPEARARHQALANPDPEEATAVALDEATSVAAARGSSIAAAELARLALDRSVDQSSESGWTRRIRLAELLHSAGSSLEAGSVLAEGSCPAGPLRARVGLILTEIAYQTSTLQRAIEHATAALADARGDAALEARCLLSLAVITTDGHDSARFTAEARHVLEAAGIDDPQLLAWAECEDVSARFHMGEGLDRVGLDHALTLERTGRTWLSSDQVAAVRPVLLKWADHPHDALAGLEELRARAEDEGNEGVIPYVAGHVPGILLRLGRLRDAAAAAADHLGLAERTGQETQRMQALYNVSLIDAHLGKLATAEAAAEEILEWARRQDDKWLEMSATSALGFIALSRDDSTTARSWLDRWSQLVDEVGVIDPGVSRFFGDHIESLVACGEIVEATARSEELERKSARARRLSAAAIAARCRALLAAAAGDSSLALQHVNRALELDDECPVPFERNRSLLAAGVIHRRARQKAASRSSLTEAEEGFAAMGAEGWSQRCERELQRVGTPARSATALTATERRIAELAATGLTNRQVAERSFLSPKTVEANLARVYRKLGITSRAELGARMGR
jgi:DNA-binding CsgD family transcriptional regulator